MWTQRSSTAMPMGDCSSVASFFCEAGGNGVTGDGTETLALSTPGASSGFGS